MTSKQHVLCLQDPISQKKNFLVFHGHINHLTVDLLLKLGKYTNNLFMIHFKLQFSCYFVQFSLFHLPLPAIFKKVIDLGSNTDTDAGVFFI